MYVDFPLRFDVKGRSATTSEEEHLGDLIEQVLFTNPGERVNRPTFGSGLMQLVFAPKSDALLAATQLTVHGALQEWLGSLIQVESVVVASEESSLRVTVQYTVRRTQERRVSEFDRAV